MFKIKKILLALALVTGIAVGAKHVLAADFSSNAVMNGGAGDKATLVKRINQGDGVNSSANLKQIYYNEGRGITEAGILSSSTVDGSVTKSGQVIVNGHVVATNVWSSGREFLQGSVHDGSLWMRPTSVSFVSNSLPAFVNVSGGTFHWAIIKSCGNPVKQISAPFGQIFKRVIDETTDPNTNHAADDQAHAVEVNTGDTLKYDVTITNNGTSVMQNVVMTDDLPAGVELVSNPSTRHIQSNFGDIAAGKLKFFDITVKVTQSTAGFITNQACFTANGNQHGCDVAIVKIVTQTPPCEQTNTCKPPTCQEQNNCKPPVCTFNCNHKPPVCKVNCNVGGGHLPSGPLPQTGAEGAAGGLVGFSALGYSARAWIRSKRDLLKALKR